MQRPGFRVTYFVYRRHGVDQCECAEAFRDHLVPLLASLSIGIGDCMFRYQWFEVIKEYS